MEDCFVPRMQEPGGEVARLLLRLFGSGEGLLERTAANTTVVAKGGGQQGADWSRRV